MCICITESPCCAPGTLWVNYTSIKRIYILRKKNEKVFRSHTSNCLNLLWETEREFGGFMLLKVLRKEHTSWRGCSENGEWKE